MPDDKHDLNLDGDPPVDESPVCCHCLEPFARHDHYCKSCGAAVGLCTVYMPYVNIQFFANFCGRLWQRTWFEKSVPVYARLFSFLLIVLKAPFMLLALPVVYLQKTRRQS